MIKHPHARSMEAITSLAMKRGAECGRPMAEAFELQRMVI